MKNIIILILFCAIGYFAGPRLGKTPKSEFANYGVYEQSDDTKICRVINSRLNRDIAVGSYAVLLDVNNAASVSEPEKLFTIYGNSRELGLMLTPQGIVGNWLGSPWKKDGVVPLSSLEKHIKPLRINNKDYLPLVIVSNGASNLVDGPWGMTIMDNRGNEVLSFPRLCTADNASYKRVELNPDYIGYVELHPRVLNNKRRVSRALSKLTKEAEAAANPQKKALIGAGIGGLLAVIIMIATPKPKAKKTV